MRAVVERDSSLAATSVVERPHVLANRSNAAEGKQQATEHQSKTH
jgi:hypothetical protein